MGGKTATDWASQQSKLQYDRGRRNLTFTTGDQVMLRLHKGYNLPNQDRKLGLQWTGPFTVTKRISEQAYQLELRRHWCIH